MQFGELTEQGQDRREEFARILVDSFPAGERDSPEAIFNSICEGEWRCFVATDAYSEMVTYGGGDVVTAGTRIAWPPAGECRYRLAGVKSGTRLTRFTLLL